MRAKWRMAEPLAPPPVPCHARVGIPLPMPRNASEFLSFVASHFRPLEAMCQRHSARFSSDDEIVAFLRPFEEHDKNLTKPIGRMQEVGVLVELAGEWTPPPFLVEFIEKVAQRFALATPKVMSVLARAANEFGRSELRYQLHRHCKPRGGPRLDCGARAARLLMVPEGPRSGVRVTPGVSCLAQETRTERRPSRVVPA